MLSALFTSLNTSLGNIVSKAFAMGSLLPVVLFLAASFGLANAIGGTPKAWAQYCNPATNSGNVPWILTAASVGIMGAAVVISGLNSFLLQLLEGKHCRWLASLLIAGQMREARRMDGLIDEYAAQLRNLDKDGEHLKLKKRLTEIG